MTMVKSLDAGAHRDISDVVDEGALIEAKEAAESAKGAFSWP
jgi:hypothetical protein